MSQRVRSNEDHRKALIVASSRADSSSSDNVIVWASVLVAWTKGNWLDCLDLHFFRHQSLL